MQRTFAALHSRNYRLWFTGQLVSLAGSWMQTTAQGYLVYELTKSPAFLGYVGFAAGLPAWVFTLYAGVVADRMSRRMLLLITQSSMMLLAFLLAGLVFTDAVQPWHILVIAAGVGVANAFDAPARLAFVVELVDREHLTNAIALNATMFNMATIVGPALAGVVYAAVGPAWCFTINGLTFIAVIVALLLMRLRPFVAKPRRDSTQQQMKQGLRYTAAEPVIRTLVLNIGVLSLFGMSLLTLLPAWATDVLGGDVTTNGLLLTFRGIGALAGALMIAYLGQRSQRGKLWTAGTIVLPFALIIFALFPVLPVSLLILTVIGWSFIVVANTSNALIQTTVPDELRGRVLGIYTLVFFGAMPLGSLVIGQVANRFDEQTAILINVVVLALAAGLIWLRLPYMRKLS
jgi:MFS family permease